MITTEKMFLLQTAVLKKIQEVEATAAIHVRSVPVLILIIMADIATTTEEILIPPAHVQVLDDVRACQYIMIRRINVPYLQSLKK